MLKHNRFIVLALIVTLTIGLAGCTSSQELRDRADQLESAADRIEQVLIDNPPEEIEESELAQAIIDRLPEDWQAAGREAIDAVGDVREGASLITAKLDEAAGKLDAQADKEASEAENTLAGVLTLTDALIGTNDLLVGLAGIFWNKKRKADAKARENEAIAEDIVTSIQSSAAMRKALDEGGGEDLRKSMRPSTQKAVKKIKNET